MLGLLIAFAGFGAAAVSGFKGYMDDLDGQIRGQQREANGENPWGVYYDGHGRCRDLRTNQPRNIDHDYRTGDTIMKDQYLHPVANLSEEWRRKRYRELQANHPEWQTTMFYGTLNRRRANDEVAGERWKDLRTGEIYVAREYNRLKFYMNMATGKFVRISDAQVLDNKRTERDYKERGLDPASNYGYATEERIRECMAAREEELKDYYKQLNDELNYRRPSNYCFTLNSKESNSDSILASEERKLMGKLAPVFYA